MKSKTKTSKHHIAFTLAEVLITLGIIGIVAQMTIPTLMNNIEDAAAKTYAKAIYSILTQASTSIIAESENLKDLDNDNFVNAMSGKLKTLNICHADASCWHAQNNWYNIVGTQISGTALYGLILQNGMMFGTSYSDSTCTSTGDGSPRGKGTCGYIYADGNGFKKPNKLGKDIFVYHIQEDGIYPGGISGSTFTACDTTGWACAAQYLNK